MRRFDIVVCACALRGSLSKVLSTSVKETPKPTLSLRKSYVLAPAFQLAESSISKLGTSSISKKLDELVAEVKRGNDKPVQEFKSIGPNEAGNFLTVGDYMTA